MLHQQRQEGEEEATYATVEEVNEAEECDLVKPEIWVSDLVSLEEEGPLEPLELEAEVQRAREEMEVGRPGIGLDVVEAPLAKIQEKSLIGSYSQGLIPIRSASFSSSGEKHVRPRRKSHASRAESGGGGDDRGAPHESKASEVNEQYGVAALSSPEITVHLIDDGQRSKRRSENSKQKEEEEEEPSQAASDAKDGGDSPNRDNSSGKTSKNKLSELLHRYGLLDSGDDDDDDGGGGDIDVDGKGKLTRALSETRRRRGQKRAGGDAGTRGARALPPSLQHLHLEANCVGTVRGGQVGGGKLVYYNYPL